MRNVPPTAAITFSGPGGLAGGQAQQPLLSPFASAVPMTLPTILTASIIKEKFVLRILGSATKKL